MPIRFRCPTCTGLMSIARRKASAVVSCPKCGEQVIVPPTASSDGGEPVANGAAGTATRTRPAARAKTVDRPLFERPDFDSLLTQAGVAAAPTPAKPVASAEPVPAPAADVIVLSYPAATMLGTGCIALIVAGFAAGYLLK